MAQRFAKAAYRMKPYIKWISVTVATAATFVPTLPETVFLYKMKDVYGKFKDNKLVPIDPDTEELIEKVLFRIQLRMKEEYALEFFNGSYNDPVHKGTIYFDYTGAKIGIPSSFSYKTEDDVINSGLTVNGTDSIEWNHPEIKPLMKSLILTEQEKSFAIAREIKYTSMGSVQVELFLRIFLIFATQITGYSLNKVFYLQRRLHAWARGITYTAIGLVYFGMYFFLKDSYHIWLDGQVDWNTAKLSKYYADGGKTYYNKVLERNIALRNLLGNDGKKFYTLYGNVTNTGVRVHNLQLTKRRDNLQKYVTMWEEGKFKK